YAGQQASCRVPNTCMFMGVREQTSRIRAPTQSAWRDLPGRKDHAMAGRTGPGRTPATTSAESFIPTHPTLAACREAVSACRGCELYRNATQGVLGEGPSHARLMLVGEQPGNDEDLAGRPFVGPAGRLLDRALTEAGLDRRTLYVTNAVKHFKWTPRG